MLFSWAIGSAPKWIALSRFEFCRPRPTRSAPNRRATFSKGSAQIGAIDRGERRKGDR